MAKRPFPFENAYERQTKTRVDEQRVLQGMAAEMAEIYSARRAAALGPVVGDMNGDTEMQNEAAGMTNEIDMGDEGYGSCEVRMSRLDDLKASEKRDPSPIPTTQHLITSFINSSRRIHGQFTKEEKSMLFSQAMTYRQLNLDAFMKSPMPVIYKSSTI